MSNQISIKQIFDADAVSLQKIVRGLHHYQDSILSELLMRPSDEQSEVYKLAISRIRELLGNADDILIEAEASLVVPESLLDPEERQRLSDDNWF